MNNLISGHVRLLGCTLVALCFLVTALAFAATTVSAAPTPLAPPTITAGPADGVTINTSHVEYRFSSTDKRVSFQCQIRPVTSSWVGCSSPLRTPITNAPEGGYTFAVRSVKGSRFSTEVSRKFTIDRTPPGLTIQDTSGEWVSRWPELPFTVVEPNFQGATCELVDATGKLIHSKKECITVTGSTCTPGCTAIYAPPPGVESEGPNTAKFVATDLAGNVSTSAVTKKVDKTPPSIVFSGDFADDDGDGYANKTWLPSNFKSPWRISDQQSGVDATSISCALKSADGSSISRIGTLLDNIIVDVTGTCDFTSAPDGESVIEVSARDYVGTVTIVKIRVIVDGTAPRIAIREQGIRAADGLDTVSFDVFDANPDNTVCTLINQTTGETTYDDQDCDEYRDTQTGEVCDDGNTDSGDTCKRTFSFPHVLETKGNYSADITHTDRAGNRHTSRINVDSAPPVVATKPGWYQDADSDGVADESVPNLFEVPFTATDIGTDLEGPPSCRVRTLDGSAFDFEGVADATGGFRCAIDLRGRSIPENSIELAIRAVDGKGHVTVLKLGFVVDRDPPHLNPMDAARFGDADGDGYADGARWQSASITVAYRVFDDTEDPASIDVSCKYKGWDGTIKGSGKITDRTGDGIGDACEVTEAQEGDGVMEITASDHVGHVTVLKIGFTVDSTPPSIAIDEQGVHFTDGQDMVSFDIDDANPGSTRCVLVAVSTGEVVDADEDCDTYLDIQSGEVCDADNADNQDCKRTYVVPHVLETSGRLRLDVTHTDRAGNTNTASTVVDRDPPVLSFTDPGYGDLDGDGFADTARWQPGTFEVPFLFDDTEGKEKITLACLKKGWDGSVKGSGRIADTDGDGFGDVCEITGADEGDLVVEIAAHDHHGHVTVLKSAFTIDTTPPAIAIDEQGIHFAGGQPVLNFDVVDTGPVTITCTLLKGGVVETRGDDCDSYKDIQTGEVCDDGNTVSGDTCKRTFSFPHVLDKSGDFTAHIVARDRSGNYGQASAQVRFPEVDTTPPVVTIEGIWDSRSDVWHALRFSVSEPGTTTCSMFDDATGRIVAGTDPHTPCGLKFNTTSGENCDPGEGSNPDCKRTWTFPHVLETSGRYRFEVTHTDLAGNSATETLVTILDNKAPAVNRDYATDPYVETSMRSSGFSVWFDASDEGVGIDPASVQCIASPESSVPVAAIVVVGDPNKYRCDFTGLPEGGVEVAIQVSDLGGHVTVLKLHFTVDATAPSIAIDEPGVQVFNEWPAIQFDLVEDHPGVTTCVLIEDQTGVSSDPDTSCGDTYTVRGNETCDEGASDPNCKRTFILPHVFEPKGSFTAVIKHVDLGGNSSSASFSFIVDRAPPVITLTNPEDADADGDEFADARVRPASFDVYFETGDIPTADQFVTSKCVLFGGYDALSIQGTAKVITDRDTGRSKCMIADAAEGVVFVAITATDAAGNSASLRRGFMVDSTAPRLAIKTKGTSAKREGSPFTPFTGLGLTIDDKDEWTEADGRCSVQYDWDFEYDADGSGTARSSRGEHCDVAIDVPSGLVRLTIAVADLAGNPSSLTAWIFGDPARPVITFQHSGHLLSGSDTPAVDFSVFDDSLVIEGGFDQMTLSCTGSFTDPPTGETLRARGIITKKPGSGGTTTGRCSFSDMPDAEIEVSVEAIDGAGFNAISSTIVEVDTTAPVVTTAPLSGEVFDAWPLIRFAVDDANRGTSHCSLTNLALGSTDADIPCGDSFARADGSTCDPVDFTTGDCLHVWGDPHVDQGDGWYRGTITHVDAAGHSASATVDFAIDRTPPVVRFTDSRDLDSDGDGYADEKYRPGSFEVPFEVYDAVGADWTSNTCAIRDSATGELRARGIIISTGTGGGGKCVFDGLEAGDVYVEITVFDRMQHAARRRTQVIVVTPPPPVDSTGPTIKIVEPFDEDSDGDGVADTLVRGTSFSLKWAAIDVESGIVHSESGCRLLDETGSSLGAFPATHLGGDQYECSVSNAANMRGTVVLRAVNYVGTVTIVKVPIVIVGDIIELTDPADADADGDGIAAKPLRSGDFDIPFSSSYAGLTAEDVTCTLSDSAGDPVAAVAVNYDPATRHGVCSVRKAKTSEATVNLRTGACCNGHVTVLKRGYVIDATPPVITDQKLVEALDGNPTLRFRVTEAHPMSTKCRVADLEGRIIQDGNCEEAEFSDATDCDDTDPDVAPDCMRTLHLPPASMTIGQEYIVTIVHTDAVGNTTTSKQVFYSQRDSDGNV